VVVARASHVGARSFSGVRVILGGAAREKLLNADESDEKYSLKTSKVQVPINAPTSITVMN